MCVFEEEFDTWSAWPPLVRAVDVSGAGDTSTAVLTLARLAGASWEEAMILANTAGGIVVGKKGTSLVSVEELLTKLELEPT